MIKGLSTFEVASPDISYEAKGYKKRVVIDCRGEVPSLDDEPKRWSVVVSGVVHSCTAVSRSL
jgi:hypothetical protein